MFKTNAMKHFLILLWYISIPFSGIGSPEYATVTQGHWTIRYNLQDGKADFFFDGIPALSDCSASVRLKNKTEITPAARPALQKTMLNDQFGKGIQVVFEHQQKDYIFRQIFRLYEKTDYFLAETEIESRGKELSTNQMNVMEAGLPSEMLHKQQQRLLFVPFDNDKWIRYNSLPTDTSFTSYEVSACYNPVSRGGLVMGSTEHSEWKTGIVWNSTAEKTMLRIQCGITSPTTRDVLPHGQITGKKIKSAPVLIGYFRDWRNGMEEYALANTLFHPSRNWEHAKPVGWNSWGKLKFDITPQKLGEVSDFIAEDLQQAGFRSGDHQFYLDLDSGWNKLDEKELEDFVRRCRENGQVPGAYFAPYGYWGENIAAKIPEEKSYKFSDAFLYANDSPQRIAKGYALDPTHPAAKARIDKRIALIKKLGFKFIKIDFMNLASLEADYYYDKQITTGMQAYNYAMKHLTDQLGDSIYITLAISPLFPSQYAHSRRIACDAWYSIKNTEYTLNGTTYGWWLSKAYCYNDPDHVVLEKGTDGENRARISSAIITGIVMLGDDYSKGGNPPAKKRALKHLTNPEINKLLRIEESFRPVEGDSGKASPLFTYEDSTGFYIAAFNYHPTDSLRLTIDLQRTGLRPDTLYEIKELWKNTSHEARKNFPLSLPPKEAAIYRFNEVKSEK